MQSQQVKGGFGIALRRFAPCVGGFSRQDGKKYSLRRIGKGAHAMQKIIKVTYDDDYPKTHN